MRWNVKFHFKQNRWEGIFDRILLMKRNNVHRIQIFLLYFGDLLMANVWWRKLKLCLSQIEFDMTKHAQKNLSNHYITTDWDFTVNDPLLIKLIVSNLRVCKIRTKWNLTSHLIIFNLHFERFSISWAYESVFEIMTESFLRLFIFDIFHSSIRCLSLLHFVFNSWINDWSIW